MKRVVGGRVFEQAEGDFEELVEDGEEDGHLGFACGREAVGEDLEARIAAASGQGGHEEHAAQMAIPLRPRWGGMTHAGATLTNARRDAEPGGGGASVGQMARD